MKDRTPYEIAGDILWQQIKARLDSARKELGSDCTNEKLGGFLLAPPEDYRRICLSTNDLQQISDMLNMSDSPTHRTETPTDLFQIITQIMEERRYDEMLRELGVGLKIEHRVMPAAPYAYFVAAA